MIAVNGETETIKSFSATGKLEKVKKTLEKIEKGKKAIDAIKETNKKYKNDPSSTKDSNSTSKGKIRK
jgi:hypothetical protein